MGRRERKLQHETVASVNVVLKYHLKSDASKSGEYSFVAAPNTNSSQFVGLTVSNNEFINGEEAVIELAAADADGNSSEPRTIETRTKRVEKLDRTNWTFPGFADNYDAQIGYSSQEAGGEGGFREVEWWLCLTATREHSGTHLGSNPPAIPTSSS